MRCVLIFIVLFFTNVIITSAQKQANVWYFGDKCALDFSAGKPVSLNNSSMTASEGGTSFADTNGKLLFYTNGILVWNGEHKTMSNGHGLKGHDSSTQS